jgi:pyruvate formate lyase activating enzyme
VVREALRKESPSIAFTYSEAITYYEYMLDTARLAKEAGLHNVLVSNGYINREPLLELCKVLDGANINLKSFDEGIYRSLNGGTLQPVLNTLRILHEQGVWLEITTLVVPTYVDDPEMIKRMCGWILKNLGPDNPLHLLRFYPQYRLTRLPPTPVATLQTLRDVAMREGVLYVYLGNVPGHQGCNTHCPNCKRLLVERNGYLLGQVNLDKGRCKFCNHVIPGRWS